jgi:asparagine synthase (glutamine-hydrolysing)
MCGIYGVWHLDNRPVDLVGLQESTNRLRHRGPDDEGYLLADPSSGRVQTCAGSDTMPGLNLPQLSAFSAEPFPLAFGFRRLAILDLSPAGHQPMASRDGRYWIVYNGEIYNYLELRQELAAQGAVFHTASDTEVILAAYQAWGPECLQRFNGMWALAIWDTQERSLFLARDRFGIKPLYYASSPEKFAFASEMKALVGIPGVNFSIEFSPNPTAIYDYLVDNRLPSPRTGETFFDGVYSLPPGHTLTVDPQGMRRSSYWELDAQAGASDEPLEAVLEEYQALFMDSVRLRLRSDVPVGSCLSGGLDSTAVVCTIDRLMHEKGFDAQQIGQQQRTFSAVYDQPGPYNERAYVDQALGSTHAQGYFVFPRVDALRRQADQLVWHQEEPFQSTSIFAQWCVLCLAQQQDITVLLDGQGADECLGGYRPFRIYLADLLRAGNFREAWQAAQAISANNDVNGGRFFNAALTDILLGGSASGRRGQRRRLASLGFLAPDFRQSAQSWEEKVTGMEDASLDSHLRDQLEDSSLPHLLRYEDRNAMAFGLETRLPFLDYRLVRFSFGPAAPWRIHAGWSKYVLRRAAQPWAPDAVIWRKDKVGFATPESGWLRQWLLEDPFWLSEPWLANDYLAIPLVKKEIHHWLNVGGDLPMLWRWMNLELWLRRWNSVGH